MDEAVTLELVRWIWEALVTAGTVTGAAALLGSLLRAIAWRQPSIGSRSRRRGSAVFALARSQFPDSPAPRGALVQRHAEPVSPLLESSPPAGGAPSQTLSLEQLKLLMPAPRSLIARWAQTDRRYARLLDVSERMLAQFGSRFRGEFPSNVVRPIPLLIAVWLTQRRAPFPAAAVDAVSGRSRDTVEWLSHPTYIGYLPVILLGLAVVAVLGRSPLIDLVRARDEAAKDANRLLAELLGSLIDLLSCLDDYTDHLESTRVSRVDSFVRRLSHDRFRWTGAGVIPGGVEIAGPLDEFPISASSNTHLSKVVETVADLDRRIKRLGLRSVAWRMIRRAAHPLVTLDLLQAWGPCSIGRRVYDERALAEFERRVEADVRLIGTPPTAGHVERVATNCDHYLTVAVGKLIDAKHEVAQLVAHLDRRVAGRTVVRLLGAVKA